MALLKIQVMRKKWQTVPLNLEFGFLTMPGDIIKVVQKNIWAGFLSPNTGIRFF